MIGSVLAPRTFLRLLASDAMNVSRDPMLILAIAMSIVPAIAFALTRQLMDQAALATFGVEQISRYVALVVLVLPAVLIGWVTGFLLLEDRDDGVLMAIDVTPIGKAGFLIYRVTVTALIGAAITAAAIPLVVPRIGWLEAAVLVAAVGADTVLAAVILPAIARNKVEGLALTKLTNVVAIFPLLILLPWPWRLLAGVIPTYWLGELVVPGVPAFSLGAVTIALIMTTAACTVFLFARLGRRVG